MGNSRGAGFFTMPRSALAAMLLKGDFGQNRKRGALSSAAPGEVAEWLKAAPC